jgi:hypothetical protein
MRDYASAKPANTEQRSASAAQASQSENEGWATMRSEAETTAER